MREETDEKVEREWRKAEKEAVGQRKMDDEMREVGGCGHWQGAVTAAQAV